jgi:hypothetical protein
LTDALEALNSKVYQIRELGFDIARIEGNSTLSELSVEEKRIICSIVNLAMEAKQLEVDRELAKIQLNVGVE